MSLPVPVARRWTPLRAGLVDLFYYDVAEFHFHDGRLLLRGNNGTGKSKVLALTLPFLLDGELAPHRVEPDGDRQKRMEWNLLLGGKHPNSERTGYSWLEFGRLTESGEAEYRTLGCGMKAARGRGIVRHWFFVTPQRVGDGLDLLSPAGTALARERLRDAVEGHGAVYDRATAYRRAVDDTLFGLGEHRYEALINLLIQLRRPQLSMKPDEKRLSDALTEALSPLPAGLIATVAEAFRGLDEDRQALDAVRQTHQATADFLGHYRRYARIAAKRGARAPRETHSRYESRSADLADAGQRQQAAREAEQRADTELVELDTLRTTLQARQEALRSGPEMRQAGRLHDLAEQARRLREYADRLAVERDRLATEKHTREAKAAAAAAEADRAAAALHERRQAAAGTADAAGLADAHAAATGDLADEPAARRATGELAARRGQAIAQLETRLREVDAARGRAQAAQAQVDRLTGEIQQADERLARAQRVAGEHAEALRRAYRDYLGELRELPVDDADEVLTALAGWAEAAEGDNPAEAAVRAAGRRADSALGAAEHDRARRHEDERAAAGQLRERITELEGGVHHGPPAPYTRGDDTRAGRPGAPLWKLVDFTADLTDADRAGLEAALESAGLLDAWVSPDGMLRERADDTVLVATAPLPGRTCAAALRPAIDPDDPSAAAVPPGTLRALLTSIALGAPATEPAAAAGDASGRVTTGSGTGLPVEATSVAEPGAGTMNWVDVDGRWGNGPLRGAWRKPAAEHIGEGAREQARRQRIARLRAELAEAGERIAALEAEGERLAGRRRDLDDELRRLPRDQDLRAAQVELAGEHRERHRLGGRHDEARRAAGERAEALRAAEAAAAEFAADVALPAGREALEAVKAALAEYRQALAELWPAAREARATRQRAGEAAGEAEQVGHRHAEAADTAADAETEAVAAHSRHIELEATAGAAVAELYRRLEEVERELRERDTAERAARRRRDEAIAASNQAEGVRQQLAGEIAQVTDERDIAVAGLRQFAATGLLRVALPDLEVPDVDAQWKPTPAVQLARTIDAELSDVDGGDPAWERAQGRIAERHKVLSDSLARHGDSAGLTPRGEVLLVDVQYQGRSHTVADLAAALETDAAQRAELLSAAEREVLENHLLGEVAGALHELMGAAETQVAAMNEELASRPTSTGMRLRLGWQSAPDAPDGLARVRDRLRQTVDAWSAEDRSTVGAFLQERIAAEHAQNPAAGWVEQLARALDYRGWHRFTIERLQDGQWRAATGPASGGERALVASVPLFAAASAHYSSAGNPHAPRLLALDEAFAGVDDTARAQYLGLLATFDMDVVMTSEREWGCYPEVPGLAICQLTRRDGIDAVLVTPWRWDGRTRTRTDRPQLTVPDQQRPTTTAPQEGLFG